MPKVGDKHFKYTKKDIKKAKKYAKNKGQELEMAPKSKKNGKKKSTSRRSKHPQNRNY